MTVEIQAKPSKIEDQVKLPPSQKASFAAARR